MATLNEIVAYLETRLNTNNVLDVIKYTGKDDQPPEVRNYGAHIYTGLEVPVERESRHIGPQLTEKWTINLDIIITKKSKTPRTAVSDQYGVSYWVDTLTGLFLHQKNSGMFKDTKWESQEVEDLNSGIRIKGFFVCESLNTY